MVRSTHTVVELPLSSAAYREIADALRAAGYGHAFIGNGMIDMTGIGVTEDRSRTPGVALFAELIRQRSEYVDPGNGYDRVPAGGVWIDRGLRSTVNTTRMCRAAVITAATGVSCMLVFHSRSHAKDAGEPTLDRVLREYDRGDGVLMIDGTEHDADDIKRLIRIVTLGEFDEKQQGIEKLAVFPDGSVVSSVMGARFRR